MDSIFAEIVKVAAMPLNIGVGQVLITLGLSVVLGLIVGILYIMTFRGSYYSQTFVQTLVIVAVVISMIILVIGSNIARAFSLAGALSIIRFRTSIRDPRDVAFIFFSMGIGLACGAGYYLPAIIFAIILSITIVVLFVTNFGRKQIIRKQLRIAMPETMNQDGVFDDVFKEYLSECELTGIKTASLGTLYELRYSIMFKKGLSEKLFLDEIRTRNGNLNVSILLEQQFLEY